MGGNTVEGLKTIGTALGERPHEIVPFLVLLLPLLAKYPPYADQSPTGPVIVVTELVWSSWTAQT